MSQVKEPPSWLNQTFLENALKKAFKNDNLQILDMEMKLATAAAENYASQMFRINLFLKTNKEGAKEKLSIIAKLTIPGEMGKEMESSQIYEREADVFASVLPVIDELLKTAYPDHKKLWADNYFYQKTPNFILILEDLRVKGFTLASRQEGLDMEHSVLAIKSLAKLHAASLIWKDRCPEKIEFYSKSPWGDKNSEILQKTVSTPFRLIAENVHTWPDYDGKETVLNKLKHHEAKALDNVLKMWQLNNSKLNVLLHGDSWTNNFMFKYDPNGKLAGINFVDFQLTSLNNPAMDLQYFIFTSVRPSLKFDFIDLLLQAYYETFDDTLKRLGHKLEKPYTFEQLKADFEERYTWGLMVMCIVYPIMVIPPNEAFHPDEFIKGETDNNYAKAYRRESLSEVFKRAFQFFEEKGVF